VRHVSAEKIAYFQIVTLGFPDLGSRLAMNMPRQQRPTDLITQAGCGFKINAISPCQGAQGRGFQGALDHIKYQPSGDDVATR